MTTGVLSSALDSPSALRAIPSPRSDAVGAVGPRVHSAHTSRLHLTRLVVASESSHWVRPRRLGGHRVMTQANGEYDTGDRPRTGVQGEGAQEQVNAHFDSSASYWDGVYRGEDLQGIIYQQRQSAVLDYVDEAHAGGDAAVLEIGCGAGHLTMQLADRGLRIDAVDASPAMVDATTARAG